MDRFRMTASVMVCVAAVWITGCATGESVVSPAFHVQRPDEVAVVGITGDIRGGAPRNQVDDFLTMELLGKGYRVVERTRVQGVLEEQEFQRSEMTDFRNAAQVGRVLNVPAVILLDVSVDGQKVSLTGRMVGTETGEVLWVGSGRGSSGGLFPTILGAVVGGAAGSQVGGGSGRTAAVIAGGVLGGVAGHELTPQSARVVQRALKRMARGMPQR